jgi:hypothetical protein
VPDASGVIGADGFAGLVKLPAAIPS